MIQTKGLTESRPSLVMREAAPEEEEEPIQAKSLDGRITHLSQSREVSLQGKSQSQEVEEDDEIHDQKVAASVESTLSSTRGGGSSLPETIQTEMESAFNSDFSGVKIHTDHRASKMNQALGAKAFTHGRDIYFNSNRYSPHSQSGRKLLAHELTHVVQQSRGRRQRKTPVGQRGKRDGMTAQKELLQLVPNVTAVNGPAEVPAGRARNVRFRATAPRGTTINWSTPGGNTTGAVLGAGTGRTNTLAIPAASTGGAITIRAADAGNAADFADTVITLVEVRLLTFAFAPAMPAFAPANTMDASVCNNTATAAAVTAPGGRVLNWSIVGNRRGATIDRATGVINPSATQTGNIRIRATDNAVAQARNEQTLTIQAFPTGISRTRIAAGGFPIPAAQGGPYGAIYTHTFRSSGGNIANVMVTERVFSGNNPFGFGGLPVLPGNLNAPAGALQDIIGTPQGGVDVNTFLPSPPNAGLPQVMNTPQILYWRSDQCSPAPAAPPAAAPGDHWVPFVNVNITATLFRSGGNFFFRTVDNGVRTNPEPYTGPALAVGGAPVASVCAPGTGVTRVRFNPASIAADGSALTTTAATAQVRPGGSGVTWSFPGQTLGAVITAQGNPALISAGNVAGRIRVRSALAATPACFAEGWLRMQEVKIGTIRFNPGSVRTTRTTTARVTTSPGSRVVTWTIQGPNLGAAIATNPDNSATITAAAQRGRIMIRAADQRDATKFTETSLVIS